ncbi:amino acid deaminase [Microbacterium sp.]|uniref:amino acid deaminase n=1 Tax=Microbacterium sp. TaxID=51671 RepID=UPI0025DA76FF|nr:amino acid deaminase [Microbacterium sp.]MBT9607398.1 amino acid deaminase [Microbacterium sp.]
MQTLDAAASLAATAPASAIDSLPWLAAALADDRAADRFAAWGRSTVIDENVGAAVLPRALFDELHRRAGLEATWPVGNAGVLHVYGYLLSSTPTPYGLKRERWLSGELERACGLPDGALLPWAGSQTLLSRTTAAASTLLARADSVAEMVDGRAARIAFGPPLADGTAALAYAVDDSIVTMFPVADPAALRDGLGTPRLRWNAA